MLMSRCFLNPWINRKPDSSEFQKHQGLQQAWEVVNLVLNNEPPQSSKGDGGLYVGIGGIAYMCYHVCHSPMWLSKKPFLISKGIEYTNAALKYIEQNKGRRRDQCGFLLGASGIYAVAAALHHLAGDSKASNKYRQMYTALSRTLLPLDFLPSGSDELFVGRAGYVAGALWLGKIVGEPILWDHEVVSLCKAMWESGKNYARRMRSPAPLMYAYYDTEYLGAAHGLSYILQVLMNAPGFLQNNPEAEADVRQTIDYLISVQFPDGNFPTTSYEATEENSETALIQWCHGAPGVLYAIAKAYTLWPDEKYLQSCLKCGEVVWQRGLLKKGPGICHGVAGNGYVFLILYRLTSDPEHLSRAQRFALFMQTEEFRNGARTPDNPFSLYEGLAGTACFLSDLLVPVQATFPFSDIFD